MLAEWGRLSLAEVLAPAIEMADGYPIEAQLVGALRRQQRAARQWPFSRALFLAARGENRRRRASSSGSPTSRARCAGWSTPSAPRSPPARAARRRSSPPTISSTGARWRASWSPRRAPRGRLVTASDLAGWRVKLEPTVTTTYRGLEVHKLTVWTQGPAMLEALNLLENADLAAMGYNSARYLHTVAQAMHLAFADRDFYYGDPAFPPEEPVAGLLSKEYARERWKDSTRRATGPTLGPGDPYPFQGGSESVRRAAAARGARRRRARRAPASRSRRCRTSTRRSAPARLRSSRPTPRAGSCR